jgi:hypothetical protein
MKTAAILARFMAHAYAKGLCLDGDEHRFFNNRTARAWHKFHHAATKGK